MNGRTLSGVIYMYRISDTRMGGVSRRNFNMFQKLWTYGRRTIWRHRNRRLIANLLEIVMSNFFSLSSRPFVSVSELSSCLFVSLSMPPLLPGAVNLDVRSCRLVASSALFKWFLWGCCSKFSIISAFDNETITLVEGFQFP